MHTAVEAYTVFRPIQFGLNTLNRIQKVTLHFRTVLFFRTMMSNMMRLKYCAFSQFNRQSTNLYVQRGPVV